MPSQQKRNKIQLKITANKNISNVQPYEMNFALTFSLFKDVRKTPQMIIYKMCIDFLFVQGEKCGSLSFDEIESLAGHK